MTLHVWINKATQERRVTAEPCPDGWDRSSHDNGDIDFRYLGSKHNSDGSPKLGRTGFHLTWVGEEALAKAAYLKIMGEIE